jgi:capsular exopolysaccharide synthesis family protein
MSLIEKAINKAIQAAGPRREAEPARPRRIVRPARPDAAAVAAHSEQARSFQSAAVDDATMERYGVLLRTEDSAAQRAYRILRTRVRQRMAAAGWNSMAVTACGEGDGKTLTSINLAIALAREIDCYVFLVDLDLQRPKVASYLGMNVQAGLSDYFEGKADFEQVVYCPGVERLGVIPNAQPLSQSSELLTSPRMAELSRALEDEHPRHIVIYDLPPLFMGDDVLKFVPSVDSVLLVVSEGTTQRAMLERAKETLHDANLLGVVLNRSAEREAGSYYY